MKIGIIILARANFGRWPDKVLYEIAGKPMIEWVIIKSLQVGYDEVIVSTTRNEEDKIIAEIADRHGVPVSYGPADSRNARYVKAVEEYNLDYIAHPAPCMPFFDVWLSRETLNYCRGNPGKEAYYPGTHSDFAYASAIYNVDLLYDSEIREANDEQFIRHPIDKEKVSAVFHFADPKIINRHLTCANIAYPFQGVIANHICNYLGRFPESHDELIRAYMEIKE